MVDVNLIKKLKKIPRKNTITVEKMKSIIIQKWYAQKYGDEPETLLFVGPPGIGKTYSVREAAEKIARREGRPLITWEQVLDGKEVPENAIVFINLNLSGMLPEDLQGLLKENEKDRVVDYVIQRWLKIASQYDTVLFIDDVGNLKNPEIRTMLYDLTQFHRLASVHLGTRSLLVMASNDSLSNADVEEFSSALINRISAYRVRFEKKQWIQYIRRIFNLEKLPDITEEDLNSPIITRNAALNIIATIVDVLEAIDGWVTYDPPKEDFSFSPWPSPRSWHKFFRELMTGTVPWDQLYIELSANVGERAANIVMAVMDTISERSPAEYIEKPELLRELKPEELAVISRSIATYAAENKTPAEKVIPVMRQLYSIYREALVAFIKTLKATNTEYLIQLWPVIMKDSDLANFIRKIAK